MDLGILIIIAFSLWLFIEILLLIIVNKNFSFSIFELKKDKNAIESEKERIRKESSLYGTRALTLGGLIFAGISLLIGTTNDINSIKNTLLILIYGFSLCLCSYKIEVLSDKRIYWTLQEKCLNFGYLTLLVSFIVYFFEKQYYEFVYLLLIFLITISFIHFLEYYSDIKLYYEHQENKIMVNKKKFFEKKPAKIAMVISLMVALIVLLTEVVRKLIEYISDLGLNLIKFDSELYGYGIGILVTILILSYFLKKFSEGLEE